MCSHELRQERDARRRAPGAVLRALASLWLVWAAAPASAIEFDEVRDYSEVFRISATALSRDRVEVRWDIEPGYYLYHNRFLRFTADTPGVVLGEASVPPGEQSFDPLLGEEVIKFHGRLAVGLPLATVPPETRSLDLKVRSQGCLEDVLCYPPTEQLVRVELPMDAGAATLASALGGVSAAASLGLEAGAGALLPEEAFTYEAVGLNAETVLVRFTAQPGYYLYVDKFAFRVVGDGPFAVREAVLPAGEIKDDPEFGPVPVIFGQVEIPVRLNRPAGPAQSVRLEADYQGCRDGDICYPPQSGVREVQLAAAAAAILGPVPGASSGAELPAAPVSEQDRLASLLTRNPPAALVAFFIAGLLLAFTPCVFPMIPILSGIIAGEGEQLTTRRAFSLSLVYVLAMALTYTVAGVIAGLFGQNLQAYFQDPWIISGFVALFVLLALSMFGFYELQLPARWQTALARYSNRPAGGRFAGVALMGLLSALIVGPCVAPPLTAALIVIGASGSALLGGSALFSLALGMGVPLIIFGVSAGKLLPTAGAWMGAVKAVFGVGLLALAVWMLERILPGVMIMLLWGALAIACGIYLGALERLPEGATGWRRARKSLGFILLLLGAIEVIGAASGGDRWTRPLAHLAGGSTGSVAPSVEFRRIKSLADLDEALAVADRPAMLDFYADWCVECIRMERNTFPEPEVAALLAQFEALQADVTRHDAIDQALMGRFDIIGPPAILFFDHQGNELRAYRLVGYFTPAEFSTHLQQVLAAVR